MKTYFRCHRLLVIALAFAQPAVGQDQWSASRIEHEIQKLPVNGTVLYVAAHPDDENTRLISWLANEKKFRTAYLSLTRGDGGQNLIGSELGVKLGAIRTNELMQARKIDGGEQYFTRAFDFGFSKSPEETLEKWNRDSVLSDMVFVIRLIQPDIMITRFPEGNYPTHGHHTASAILASEAYEAAADPKRFPEQFTYGVKPWAVKRLLFNASPWWNKDLPALAASNDSFFSVDVGGYNPLLGASYTEIAGRSRSMHKSQGFGSAEPAGEQLEYLKLLKSREPLPGKDPLAFAGDRIANEQFYDIYNKLAYNSDIKTFKEFMTNIVMLKKWYAGQPKTPLLLYREAQVDEIIRQLCGLKLKLNAQNPEFAQGDSIQAEFSILNRSAARINLIAIHAYQGIERISPNEIRVENLAANRLYTQKLSFRLQNDYVSELPWMQHGKTETMFNNTWREGVIYHGTDRGLRVKIHVEIEGVLLEFPVTLTHESVDPVKGEIRNPVLVIPALEIKTDAEQVLFINTLRDTFSFELHSHASSYGPLVMQLKGKYSAPRPVRDDLNLKSDSILRISIPIESLNADDPGELHLRYSSRLLNRSVIEYDHIGKIQHCEAPVIRLIPLEIKQRNKRIAYLQGAGDEVDHYLRLAGYEVKTIGVDQFAPSALAGFDVVMIGIRAFNTIELDPQQEAALLAFVENGGTVIMQYHTNRGLKGSIPSPYPFRIGRDRVTVEDAKMEVISANEPILTEPNKLVEKDFHYWVQERGLYFVDSADTRYRYVFTAHDPGEKDLNGGLIIGHHGKGTFIYTGLAFFRQLPAGVPGAYRLLGNMIDYEAKP